MVSGSRFQVSSLANDQSLGSVDICRFFILSSPQGVSKGENRQGKTPFDTRFAPQTATQDAFPPPNMKRQQNLISNFRRCESENLPVGASIQPAILGEQQGAHRFIKIQGAVFGNFTRLGVQKDDLPVLRADQ